MDNIRNYHLGLQHLKAQPLEEELVKHLSKPDEIRSIYQKDRDRIMYGKAFRRLAGKTQVFLAGHDDYNRTRLTHTLEVSQIAKTISGFLGLDVDLTEAIASGHDIGHAPFGHVGERVINHFSNGCDNYKDSMRRTDYYDLKNWMGFKHNWQSVRIAESLARHKENYGLKLSKQTLYGILNHTILDYKSCNYFCNSHCNYRKRGDSTECIKENLCLDFYITNYSDINNCLYFTVESIIVSISDEIAQIHHDLEDGLRNNIFSLESLLDEIKSIISFDNYTKIKTITNKKETTNRIEDIITILSSDLINYFVSNTIIKLATYFQDFSYSDISIESRVMKIRDETKFSFIFKKCENIQKFMYKRILNSHIAQVMDGRAEYLLRRLFKAYLSNPQQLPDNTLLAFKRNIDLEYEDKSQHNKKSIEKIENYKEIGHLRVNLDKLLNGIENEAVDGVFYDFSKNRAILLRTICDYVSGMTDRRATSEYQRLYGIEKDIREL
ncbi:dNTP triphosphohydrolase [bacterium]|nr:dNTP triphosphohydrolase [bacterium]